MKGKRITKQKNSSSNARSIDNAGDQIVKRMTLSGGTLATGAGTVIAISAASTITSSGCQSAPAAEWASFAARYQQYRVRAIRVRGKAINPVETATIVHSVLFRADYIGSSGPATAAQVLSDERAQENCTCKDFSHTVTWIRNPNARLWNPTGAAIPAANQFAWVAATPATPPLLTGTTYYALVVEWEVEFRGSQ
jgi:hypothetical protein